MFLHPILINLVNREWDRCIPAPTHLNWSGVMSNVLKVIEILAESPTSWEEAAAAAVTKASETVHGVKSIYIKNFEAQVQNNKITSYRVNAKITFVLD
jgi:dodecin